VRIDLAASVTYDFKEGSQQHAQSFASFQAHVLDSFKKNSEADSAAFLLELLLEHGGKIL